MIFVAIRVIALIVFAISFYEAHLNIRSAVLFHDDFIKELNRNRYRADEYKCQSNKNFAFGIFWSVIVIVCAILIAI